MANDAGNCLSYWLALDRKYTDALYELRAWNHLELATTDDLLWVRGFTEAEMKSVKVLGLPNASRYSVADDQLVPHGRRLPVGPAPEFTWTPIQQALKVSLPPENFNYFGLHEAHTIRIVPATEAREVDAAIVALAELEAYVAQASRIRLQGLNWTVLDAERALVLGRPVLPIRGEDYFQEACFLIPAGMRLRHERLRELYAQALAAVPACWYLISEQGGVFKIKKENFTPLRKGSVRNTRTLLDRLTPPPTLVPWK